MRSAETLPSGVSTTSLFHSHSPAWIVGGSNPHTLKRKAKALKLSLNAILPCRPQRASFSHSSVISILSFVICAPARCPRPFDNLCCRAVSFLKTDGRPRASPRAMNASENEHRAMPLAPSGLRMPRQRQQVFDVVADSHDHPTAEQIFERAKKANPEISFATVYNCLSVLAECGLVRQ